MHLPTGKNPCEFFSVFFFCNEIEGNVDFRVCDRHENVVCRLHIVVHDQVGGEVWQDGGRDQIFKRCPVSMHEEARARLFFIDDVTSKAQVWHDDHVLTVDVGKGSVKEQLGNLT